MDTETPPTLFERTSGGRFLDASLRYDFGDIEDLRRYPYRACACCRGDGVHLEVLAVRTPLGLIPLGVSTVKPCDTCDGTGFVSYQSYN